MYTIFTVDVEGHVGIDPVNRLIYGKTANGELCGIDMIMDMLEVFSIKGLFFVDIAEAWDYGKEKIIGVLKHISERGHDVGVHIHPDHMADRRRLFLSEYSWDEQYEIIAKCTELYSQALQKGPIAFRAGKYGANRETLDILGRLGYKADLSQFYGQKWCHINPPVAKVNVQKLDNGMLEIPVTAYISLNTAVYSRYDKVDCGQRFSEFKTLFQKLELNGNDIVVLFAHSFSLLNWRRTPNNPQLNREMKNRLEKQLAFVQGRDGTGNNVDIDKVIAIFENCSARDIDEEKLVTLNGIKPLFWFADRAKAVIKSKYDIKYRRL